MENSFRVVVIIPVINRPHTVMPTLDGVRKQTLQPKHLVAVGNCINRTEICV